MPMRWPSISRPSRQATPSAPNELDLSPAIPKAVSLPVPKPNLKCMRRVSGPVKRGSILAGEPPASSEPANPTEQFLRNLGIDDPGLSRIFNDAAQYDQLVCEDPQELEQPVGLTHGADERQLHASLRGFSRLVGKDLPRAERQASIRLAQLSVNNFASSAFSAPMLSEDEGEAITQEQGAGSRISETSREDILVDELTPEERFEAAEKELKESEKEDKLEPEQIVHLLEEEFGALAEPGDEKLVLETDGSLIQDVIILGVLHLTTHRLTFHASLLSASGDEPKIIKAGTVLVHRKGWHRKARVWMELAHDLIACYPSSKDEDRIKPIRSILLSAVKLVHAYEHDRPRIVRMSYEGASSIQNEALEFDTEEAARDWRRELHGALFLYRRSRRHALNPSEDDANGVRFNIPLARIESVEHSHYLSLASLLSLRVSTAAFPMGVAPAVDSSPPALGDTSAPTTPSALPSSDGAEPHFNTPEPESTLVQIGILKELPEKTKLEEYAARARAYEAARPVHSSLSHIYFDYGMHDGLPGTSRSPSASSDEEDEHEPRVHNPHRGLAQFLGFDLESQPWTTKAYISRRFSRMYGTFVVADDIVGFFSRAAFGRDMSYRVPFNLVKDVHPAPASIQFKWADHAIVLVMHSQADLRFLFRSAAARDEAVSRIEAALERVKMRGAVTASPQSASPLPTPDVTRPSSTHSSAGKPEQVDELAPLPSPGLSGTESSDVVGKRLDLLPRRSRSTTSILAPVSRLPTMTKMPVLYSFKSYFPKPINIRPGLPNVKPMHFMCLTIGSRGDVQPYIALGKGLQSHGHKVTIVTHEEYKGWVEGFGIGHRTAGGDPGALMKLSVENKMFSPQFFKESLGNFRSWLDELLVDAWEQCKDADVLLESPSAMAGVHIAEALKIPYFRTFTMPWTKTREFPHAFLSPPVESPTFNSASYVLFDNVFWTATSGQINRWRKATLGIGPTDMGHLAQSKIPFIYNFSPAVVPKPLDWGDATTISGYWFLDNPDLDWTPLPGLQAFMDKARADGRPLAYIGFGSIVVPDPVGLSKNIIAAVVKADVRAIVSRGWSARMARPGTESEDVVYPEQCFVLDKVPHDWLFPLCDVVVHHGGAGTTGASLRAGVPTLIRPWFGDQFFWASRVQRLGAGLRINSVRASELADALKRATSDRVMKEKAASVGERIRAENGVKTAIEAIYTYLPRAAHRTESD